MDPGWWEPLSLAQSVLLLLVAVETAVGSLAKACLLVQGSVLFLSRAGGLEALPASPVRLALWLLDGGRSEDCFRTGRMPGEWGKGPINLFTAAFLGRGENK